MHNAYHVIPNVADPLKIWKLITSVRRTEKIMILPLSCGRKTRSNRLFVVGHPTWHCISQKSETTVRPSTMNIYKNRKYEYTAHNAMPQSLKPCQVDFRSLSTENCNILYVIIYCAKNRRQSLILAFTLEDYKNKTFLRRCIISYRFRIKPKTSNHW